MINFNLGVSKNLSYNYQNSLPFPHVVLDNFLNQKILDVALEEIKGIKDWGCDRGNIYMDYWQPNKFYYPDYSKIINSNFDFPPISNLIVKYLNSPEFLDFLSNLTGISNLLPDDSLFGGGIHKIKKGGRLGVHVDFNQHKQTKLWRRVNLLLYLNKDWKKDFKGDLELWDKDSHKMIKSIEPIFNRCVIFTLSEESYHGHPEPLNCEDEDSRYSFALYYYTKEEPVHTNINNSAIWLETNTNINSNNDVNNNNQFIGRV